MEFNLSVEEEKKVRERIFVRLGEEKPREGGARS